MVQRPPDDEDPTSEEEAIEFDGTHTDQLDDTYRLRVVLTSESANGVVSFDDRGQAQWKWITEIGGTTADVSGTFNQLRALDNPTLALKDETPPAPEPTRKTGYDPYATGVFPKPKPMPTSPRDSTPSGPDAPPARDPVVNEEPKASAPKPPPEPSYDPYDRAPMNPARKL